MEDDQEKSRQLIDWSDKIQNLRARITKSSYMY